MITHSVKSAMLLAPVEGFDPASGAAALALGLCPLLGAGLTAVILDLQGSTPGRTVDADAETEAAASALRAAAAARSIDLEVVTRLSHSFGVGGCLADHLRLHDVGIVGADRAGLMSERMLAEHLVFDSGRPVIVAPAALQRPVGLGRIAVAWDNSRSAARALNDAVALFGAGPEYVLLGIDDDKTIASSLDADEALTVLRRRGLKASCESARRGGTSIGDALQETALRLGADVLAMGGFVRSRLYQALLGGATAQVLDNPRLPVLLSH